MQTQHYLNICHALNIPEALLAEVEPYSRHIFARVEAMLGSWNELGSLDVELPLCLMIEHEMRTALMMTTSWEQLKEWLHSFKKMSVRDIRRALNRNQASLSDQTLRTLFFYRSCRTPKKFHPSIADVAFLLSLESKGPLRHATHHCTSDELKQWGAALSFIQKRRNACVHGHFHEQTDLKQFLSAIQTSLELTLRWKNQPVLTCCAVQVA